MSSITQTGRLIRVSTTLRDDTYIARSMTVLERVSEPFEIEVEGFLQNKDVKPEDLIMSSVNCELLLRDDSLRVFNGIVRATHTGLGGTRIHIVPWFWFLQKRQNSRIFQNRTTIDIVKEVFDSVGIPAPRTDGVRRSLTPREYCVQWQETDFDFVSRLLEEEGIFYTFAHKTDAHDMILADSVSAYSAAPESEIEYTPGSQVEDHLWTWDHGHQFVTSRYMHRDYNFETPGTKLKTEEKSKLKFTGEIKDEIVRYDYPGRFPDAGLARELGRIRIQEQEAGFDRVSATGSCRTLAPGLTFQMKCEDFPYDDGNKFVVIGVQHQAVEGSYRPGQDSGLTHYENSLECIPSDVLFRPTRLTPKPVINSTQTAVVVGARGDEIYVDKYGRIKVQFHWDEYGEKDQDSSCWIRVAQSISGKTWGASYLPRVGQEVVVAFVDGDPDRPLIIGSVYNAEQMPPYSLPGNKTQSGFKSRSTKSGGTEDFNELRFEDKKGSEEVYFHAQKDFKRHVENDDELEVENDQKVEIGNDQDIEVANDRTIKVDGKIFEQAMKSIELKVGSSSIKIDPTSITIKAVNITIQGSAKIDEKAPMINISADGILTAKGSLVKIN